VSGILMKIKCIKKIDKTEYKPNDFKIYFGDLEYGKIYDVISIEKEWYRVIDRSDEAYLYPPELFEVVN